MNSSWHKDLCRRNGCARRRTAVLAVGPSQHLREKGAKAFSDISWIAFLLYLLFFIASTHISYWRKRRIYLLRGWNVLLHRAMNFLSRFLYSFLYLFIVVLERNVVCMKNWIKRSEHIFFFHVEKNLIKRFSVRIFPLILHHLLLNFCWIAIFETHF